uniref:WW domain-containing protein n=1 Tax=Scleropages formosus TaxID=113540 RepID=A0A8D0CLK6_SCLFO
MRGGGHSTTTEPPRTYMLYLLYNIWNDQNLELDSDLPPGWRTIRDSAGTYYWHVPTGTTQWQHPCHSAEDEHNTTHSTCFSVRSLGWVEIPDEDLIPGKSSIAVNNCIQQLSNGKWEGRDAAGACGQGQDMVMVLKKDTLSLLDPVDHSLIHCQLLVNIRLWGVGCNNGRCAGVHSWYR